VKRVNDLFLEQLEVLVIPGVMMVQRFYKIKVTAGLDRTVRLGQLCPAETVIYRHTPRVPSRRNRPLDNCKLVLQCYEGFKKFVYPNLGMLVFFHPVIDAKLIRMVLQTEVYSSEHHCGLSTCMVQEAGPCLIFTPMYKSNKLVPYSWNMTGKLPSRAVDNHLCGVNHVSEFDLKTGRKGIRSYVE
jgi:hypothetical protein